MTPLLSKLAVALVVAVAAGYLLLGRGGDTPREDAHRLVAQGARLVDVRTPEEFGGGHLDGAVNLPVDELQARMGELMPKDAPIVLYCRSGRRSSRAKTMLVDAGFTSVHDLGGMGNW